MMAAMTESSDSMQSMRLSELLAGTAYVPGSCDARITGIATDSARVSRSVTWARWLAKPLRGLFAGRPLPDLEVPVH